jgi:enamine deaminase RidA (YjgF/YER057c/UK114 family)
MSDRINYSSDSIWEEKTGYSRAVKIGNLIEVSGTVAADEKGNIIGQDDAYLQTKFILEKIEAVLSRAGASMRDVVRTRMFVTDISLFNEYGRAHNEFFREIRPATAMYEISALVSGEFLIEIEATAILPNNQHTLDPSR